MAAPAPKVLITAAGGAGTIEVLRALGSRYHLIACDASWSAGGFAFSNAGYVVPFSASPEFPAVLRHILSEERPDFVIPLVDEEILIVHDVVRDYPETRVVGPTPAFSRSMLDKWTMFETFERHGIPVARTWLASDANAATYPAIVKPRSGRGSRGFATLESAHDLQRYLAETKHPADHFIVQERLVGREFTTSVVVALDGTCLTVVPKEAVEKRGITQIGVTRYVPEIDAVGRQIQATLAADGPFNVQLMFGDDRVPRIFEVNPRYSTTVALTLAAGVNEVDIVLQRALGVSAPIPEFERDLMMLRYTSQVYVREDQWHPIVAAKSL